MAEYESIHGTRVRYLSSDPTLTESSTEGQVWYNSTSGTNKALVQIKAFSAGSNIPTAGSGNASAVQATQTTALSFGLGSAQPQTIEYNGYAWTAGGALGTGRFVLRGAGTQTAALGFGGYVDPGGFTTATEEYDGSSWTAGGALPSSRSNMGGGGTQTAALSVGGGGPVSPGNNTEEYNGSSWTAGGAYPVALQDVCIAGPQTATLGAGGITGQPTDTSTAVANYDGSSWTVLPGTISNGQNRAVTAGTQTHAVIFGGNINTPPPAGPGTPGVVTTANNEWDGSTFTVTANMATARQSFAGAGTGSAAIGYAGDLNPGNSNATEEYNSSINAITNSAWASGGALPTGVYFSGGAGDKDAALSIGGSRFAPPAGVNTVNIYNGSTWTGGPNLNYSARGTGMSGGPKTAAWVGGGAFPSYPTILNNFSTWNDSSWTAGPTLATNTSDAGGTGPQTAGIVFGGRTGPTDNPGNTETYDGTSWSETADLNTGRSNSGSSGTSSSSAFVAGGLVQPSTLSSAAETWDGISWTTSSGTLATARYGIKGAGTTSAGVFYGGLTPSFSSATEEYNFGTTTITPAAWSSGGNTNDSRRALGSVGSQTAGLAFGGRLSPTASPPADFVTKTEQYDGTSWTEVNDLNNGRSNIGGAGTQTAAVAFGGLNPALGPRPATNTETWDGTNWTNGTASPTAAENYGSCGTLTAALRYGGDDSPVGPSNSTLEFDGSSFTTGGNMNTARNLIQGSAGSQTAGLAFGGTGPNNQTEEYNGSAWTSVNNLNNANYYNSSGSSPQTDALGFGSSPGTSVEQYNGTSWFTAPNLGTQRADGTGFGTSANGSVMVNGPSGPTSYPSATEEFTGEVVTTNPASNLSVS